MDFTLLDFDWVGRHEPRGLSLHNRAEDSTWYEFASHMASTWLRLDVKPILCSFQELLGELGVTHHEQDGPAGQGGITSDNKLGQILRLKVVHLMAFFLVLYGGTEIPMGGWMVSFLLAKRNGDSNTGYVSSGFFGGKRAVSFTNHT
jgi:fucose permease